MVILWIFEFKSTWISVESTIIKALSRGLDVHMLFKIPKTQSMNCSTLNLDKNPYYLIIKGHIYNTSEITQIFSIFNLWNHIRNIIREKQGQQHHFKHNTSFHSRFNTLFCHLLLNTSRIENIKYLAQQNPFQVFHINNHLKIHLKHKMKYVIPL